MRPPFLGITSELTKDQLRGPRVRRLHRGVYGWAQGTAAASDGARQRVELLVRCRGALLVFPDAVVCGITAGRWLGLPVDDDGVVHLARGAAAARSRRHQVAIHRLALTAGERTIEDGLPVATGPRLLTDLSVVLGLEPLVALGDTVVRRWGRPAVDAAVTTHGSRRGAVLLRRALPLLDPGADSPAETRARLRLHAAGFTALRHKVAILDEDGGWLAAPDLADPDARVAVQYDGLVHWESGPARWRHDLDQDELVRAQGWQLVRTTSLDDADPRRLIDKVAAAYGRSAVLRGRP